MMYPSIHHAARRMPLYTPLLLAVILYLAAGAAFAAAVGDQVELKAMHPAGVPFHHAPRATQDFQRLPDGTRAHVIEVAPDSRWLKLALSDGRTGWITSRYVRASAPGTPPAPTKPQRIEEGTVTSVADGDTLTVVTSNQTKLRIRMFGIDAPAGSFIFLPRDHIHTFQNIGAETGLLLVGVTPAGLEHFFVERQGVDMETQQALFKKYGVDVVGPPLGSASTPASRR
jgi:hypothetical protein